MTPEEILALRQNWTQADRMQFVTQMTGAQTGLSSGGFQMMPAPGEGGVPPRFAQGPPYQPGRCAPNMICADPRPPSPPHRPPDGKDRPIARPTPRPAGSCAGGKCDCPGGRCAGADVGPDRYLHQALREIKKQLPVAFPIDPEEQRQRFCTTFTRELDLMRSSDPDTRRRGQQQLLAALKQAPCRRLPAPDAQGIIQGQAEWEKTPSPAQDPTTHQVVRDALADPQFREERLRLGKICAEKLAALDIDDPRNPYWRSHVPSDVTVRRWRAAGWTRGYDGWKPPPHIPEIEECKPTWLRLAEQRSPVADARPPDRPPMPDARPGVWHEQYQAGGRPPPAMDPRAPMSGYAEMARPPMPWEYGPPQPGAEGPSPSAEVDLAMTRRPPWDSFPDLFQENLPDYGDGGTVSATQFNVSFEEDGTTWRAYQV